jgi:hypothetical protein
VDRYTGDQDKAMAAALLFIRKLQAAAKARYKTGDGPMMREFRVGAKPSQTVKGMMGDITYLKGVAEKRAGDLPKFGFKPADMWFGQKALLHEKELIGQTRSIEVFR